VLLSHKNDSLIESISLIIESIVASRNEINLEKNNLFAGPDDVGKTQILRGVQGKMPDKNKLAIS
jgi:hypothetical protein